MWIVNQLTRHPEGLTFSRINELWKQNEALSGGMEMERRTFYNYRQGAFDLFEVVIEYDDKARKYKIVARDDNSGISQWLLKSFTVSEAISTHKNLSHRIVLEEIPSGQEYLDPLLEALRSNLKVSFHYQHFNDYAPHPIREAEPYCLKLYRQRWYLLVKEYRTLLVTHEKVPEMQIYSLDRISGLQLTDQSFELDPLFDAQQYFKYAFGTRVYKDNEPEKVLLKVEAGQAHYLRTLPLHHSQREVERTEEYSVFELHVALTIELYLQILYYGSRIEVLSPTELQDIIRLEVYNMAVKNGLIEPTPDDDAEERMEEIKNNPEEYEKKYSQDIYRGIFH